MGIKCCNGSNHKYWLSTGQGQTEVKASKSRSEIVIPDFDDHKEAYKSKNWLSLVRAFVVFQLCSVNSLVDKQLTVRIHF